MSHSLYIRPVLSKPNCRSFSIRAASESVLLVGWADDHPTKGALHLRIVPFEALPLEKPLSSCGELPLEWWDRDVFVGNRTLASLDVREGAPWRLRVVTSRDDYFLSTTEHTPIYDIVGIDNSVHVFRGVDASPSGRHLFLLTVDRAEHICIWQLALPSPSDAQSTAIKAELLHRFYLCRRVMLCRTDGRFVYAKSFSLLAGWTVYDTAAKRELSLADPLPSGAFCLRDGRLLAWSCGRLPAPNQLRCYDLKRGTANTTPVAVKHLHTAEPQVLWPYAVAMHGDRVFAELDDTLCMGSTPSATTTLEEMMTSAMWWSLPQERRATHLASKSFSTRALILGEYGLSDPVHIAT